KSLPGLALRSAATWQRSLFATVIVVALFAVHGLLVRPDIADRPSPPSASTANPASTATTGSTPSGGAFGNAAKVFGEATGPSGGSGDTAGPNSKPAAGSMDTAIASLEARLAKGGGT